MGIVRPGRAIAVGLLAGVLVLSAQAGAQRNADLLAQSPSCAAVADATYVAATSSSGSGTVTLYWASANSPLILRKTAPFDSEAPTGGVNHSAGNTIGAATVVYDGSSGIPGMSCSGSSCTNSGLSNETYYYKVFPRLGNCYGLGIGAEVNSTVQSGTHPAWSYTLAGGSMLKAGTARQGAIYTGSNASRIVSLSTANGAQRWAPLATKDAVQAWPIFISGGSNGVVVGGDQSANVYAVNTATGTTYWTRDLGVDGADGVQAPAAAQLRVLSDATFQGTHATDLLFVPTRNSSSTNNKVFALRLSDGSIAWTFNRSGTDHAVDYIVGQPYVDYARNRVYVVSGAGAGTQASLWVINTLDGALVASFPLGHVETSPTLSVSATTLWVANTSGNLYAINAATLAPKWTSPAALGSAVKGFVWEDVTTTGRLYLSTVDGNVWCLQDPGTGPPPNPASPVWKTLVAGASAPLLLGSLYVGSSDGTIHELNLIHGADAKQFPIDSVTVGDLSSETATEIFASTSAGKIYKIPLPLP